MQRSKKCSPQDKQYNAVSRIEILLSTLSPSKDNLERIVVFCGKSLIKIPFQPLQWPLFTLAARCEMMADPSLPRPEAN